jgi:DNA-binding transcriptional LysR family regulator
VIDVAIMRPTAMDADLEVMDAFAEPMLLATRRDSDLAKRHSIGLDAISELPLIGYAKAVSPYFRQMVQSLFASIQQRPNVVQESVIPTVLTLVEAGVGVALVPWSITRNRGESLAFLRLSTRGLPKARIVLAALLKDRNPAVAGFLAALRAS